MQFMNMVPQLWNTQVWF